MMIADFIRVPADFPLELNALPWEVTAALAHTLYPLLDRLDEGYRVQEGVAVHHLARIGRHAVIKAPAIIGAGCLVGANSYIRGGVYLGEGAKVGIACEVKSSILMPGSAVAHLNFIGDSIIGSRANFEAGAITANHYNERSDKKISVTYRGEKIATHCEKFGALVGDDARIGANAVLSPGTLLAAGAVVARLALVEQNPL
ncbi:LpxA family transferase [Uruburuella testudinis]|uniref:LpxA family transferase n=1 Tax=Uruburuella testudinis TaxID=1282863 RepID=A0ABY4DQH6_9NEIS|nr:DapH/DapD/GlmU-related protein [Uruburuella testudinis]UOO81286.1 LpxA family transferase [Uruburuella testudinis]